MIWIGMRNRCENTNNTAYHNYGGRGLKVCKRWSKFVNFLADMGEPPDGLSLERRNNSKGYSKANCRWANGFEQANNRRGNKLITYSGKTLTVTEWARKVGLKPKAVRQRVRMGWTPDRALTTPLKRKRQSA